MVTGAHVPADEAFCEALKLLMTTVDYRQVALERPDCAGGLTAWADHHRATAMAQVMEGLDVASGQ